MKEAGISRVEIRKEVWFSDPGYHLEELPDILEWMTLREQEGVTVAEEETETKKGQHIFHHSLLLPFHIKFWFKRVVIYPIPEEMAKTLQQMFCLKSSNQSPCYGF